MLGLALLPLGSPRVAPRATVLAVAGGRLARRPRARGHRDEQLDLGRRARWGRSFGALLLAGLLAAVVHGRIDRTQRQVDQALAFAEDATVHDPLTGLANRKGLSMLGAQILETARRRGDAVYCMFLDVDGLGADQLRPRSRRRRRDPAHGGRGPVALDPGDRRGRPVGRRRVRRRRPRHGPGAAGDGATGPCPLPRELAAAARAVGGADQCRRRRARAVGRRRRQHPAAPGRPRDAAAPGPAPRGCGTAVPAGAPRPEPLPARHPAPAGWSE